MEIVLGGWGDDGGWAECSASPFFALMKIRSEVAKIKMGNVYFH